MSVHLDGARVARLRPGTSAQLPMPEGPHVLRLSIDWWRSDPITVVLSGDHDTNVQFGMRWPGWPRRLIVTLYDPSLPRIDDLIAGRLQRQQILYDRAKRFHFIIAEPVLRGRLVLFMTTNLTPGSERCGRYFRDRLVLYGASQA
ncbi:MAG TPA: hypothetical protein VGL20_01250 [Candidatus Dormibacteraeota bacterium]